jgi:hypothetical protein
MGVLFNNFIFENRGPSLSETWIYGSEIANYEKSELIAQFQKDRALFTAKPHVPPLHVELTQWPQALPEYSHHLRNFLDTNPFDSFKEKNIYFIGNYLGDIGLSKIATKARLLAQEIGKKHGSHSLN